MFSNSSIKPILISLLLLFLLPIPSQSQNKQYAFDIVDTLTQEYFGGRGYDGSDKKAANFIADEFQKMGLKPINNSYFQAFPISINTMLDSIHISLDQEKLSPGKDYLILLSSPSLQGVFDLTYITSDSNNILNINHKESYYKNKFVVTDLSPRAFKKQFSNPVKGIIYLKESSFFWHISDGRELNSQVEIYLRKEKFNTSTKRINISLKTNYQDAYITQNVLGMVKGTKYPNEYIFLTAHYDHLGRMGVRTFFPGGHDNASGTATVMDLASYYAKHPSEKTLVFVLFSGEEAGLLGSFFYTQNPLLPLEKTTFVLNLDLMGAGSNGIMVVNGKVYTDYYDKLLKINKEKDLLFQIKARGRAANSDHFPFSEIGIPSFFFYTLGKESSEYHSPKDNLKNVHFSDYDDLFELITTFVEDL